MSAAAPHPSSGRLAPRPFVLAVIAVYLLSFVSQTLLSAPVTARLSVLPFVLAQTVLIWFWILLHRRRLIDAGRPTGIVIGVALVYALQVVLMVLLIWMVVAANAGSNEAAVAGAGLLHLFVVLYLLGTMAGDPTLGVLQIWLIGFVAMMLLPVVIALCFSIWTATRPRLSAPP